MKSISDLLNSDMEDVENIIDENSILSSASDASAAAPTRRKTTQAKKPRKRKPVTMPKSKSRVTKTQGDGPAKKTAKATAGAKRKALEEQVNGQNTKAESVTESEDELESPKTLLQTKSGATSKVKPKKTQHTTEGPEEMEVDQTPMVARSSHAQSKPAKAAPKVTKKTAAPKAKQAKSAPAVIAETQLEQEFESDADTNEVREPLHRPRESSTVRTASRRPPDVGYRRRAGSASDTERGDPNLRRKLGDITLKFENIDLKYRNLKEIGIHEATTNAEKMRKQCETTTQASVELITSLKKELAMRAPVAQDARKMQKEIHAKGDEMAKLQHTVSDLTRSLSEAQNEIKALQAKLSASRSTSAENSNSKTPGSVGRTTRTVVAGCVEAIQAAQAAQMKEDLYSDLTGLIIRSVKKTPEGDAYDCIQTGRNGSKCSSIRNSQLQANDCVIALHFKLYVDQEDAKSLSFEETEFLYTPLLDVNRDREMMELMPDYLRDEITFARQNAAKFYSRVVDTLTKRRVDE
jgi:Chromosome segregation protein Csm1/Pcs1